MKTEEEFGGSQRPRRRAVWLRRMARVSAVACLLFAAAGVAIPLVWPGHVNLDVYRPADGKRLPVSFQVGFHVTSPTNLRVTVRRYWGTSANNSRPTGWYAHREWRMSLTEPLFFPKAWKSGSSGRGGGGFNLQIWFPYLGVAAVAIVLHWMARRRRLPKNLHGFSMSEGNEALPRTSDGEP